MDGFVSHTLAHGAGRAAPARDRQSREHDRAPGRVRLRVRILARISRLRGSRQVGIGQSCDNGASSRGAARARLVTARAQRVAGQGRIVRVALFAPPVERAGVRHVERRIRA